MVAMLVFKNATKVFLKKATEKGVRGVQVLSGEIENVNIQRADP